MILPTQIVEGNISKNTQFLVMSRGFLIQLEIK